MNNTVNQHIQKAKDIIYGNSTIIESRKIFDSVKAEVKEIQSDVTLSGIGIAEKEREVRRKGAVELAKIVKASKAQVDKELDAAEKAAQAAISKPNEQPAQFQIDEFNEKYRELKTELTVFGNATAANNYVQFMNGITNPYFARIVKDEFAEIGGTLQRHISDPMRVRTAYDKVKSVAETDGRAMARKALDEIGTLRKSMPVNSQISWGIESALGSSHTDVLTNYERYLN